MDQIGINTRLPIQAPSLLSKQGLVVIELARTLLTQLPGERIPRIQAFATHLDASVGTVQAALEYLQASGAVRLEARGRQGTYALELHYPLLWSLALNRPIIGALPLPYSRRFEGLATGVRTQFAREPLDLDLRFMRGAVQRMQALATHACDWTLISRFATETANAHGFAVETVMQLGAQSYMTGHVLVLATQGATGVQDGMRIGVDLHSADHVYLVRVISRGKHVELVPIDYSQGLKLVRSGVIDATVWSQEDMPIDLSTLTMVALDPQTEPALAALSEGVIVINQDDRAMAHLLRATLDRSELLEIQQDVLQRKRLPAY